MQKTRGFLPEREAAGLFGLTGKPSGLCVREDIDLIRPALRGTFPWQGKAFGGAFPRLPPGGKLSPARGTDEGRACGTRCTAPFDIKTAKRPAALSRKGERPRAFFGVISPVRRSPACGWGWRCSADICPDTARRPHRQRVRPPYRPRRFSGSRPNG